MKVLANDGISAKAKAALEAEGITVSTDHVEQAHLIDTLNREGYAGILVRSATKVRQDLIDACPDLRFIGRGGVGMDNIDVEYARSHGKVVFNTPAASSQSVAELVMAHLFAMARSLHQSYPAMPERGADEFKVLKKAYAKGIELRGKTLGIVGFGRIGTAVAQYALGCGMNVIGVDQVGESRTVPVRIPTGGDSFEEVTVTVPLVSLSELLAQADAVTFHVPAQADGSPVLDAAGVSSMKAGAMLVNTARGGTGGRGGRLCRCGFRSPAGSCLGRLRRRTQAEGGSADGTGSGAHATHRSGHPRGAGPHRRRTGRAHPRIALIRGPHRTTRCGAAFNDHEARPPEALLPGYCHQPTRRIWWPPGAM